MLLYNQDCIDALDELKDNSVDSIVTDPPYLIGIVNKAWDKTDISINVEMWKKCYRVLKPGGFLLAFSSTKNYHKITTAIENAGFDIKDVIQWLNGQGMPKGQDIAKSIEAKLTTGKASTTEFKNLDGKKGITSLGYNKRNVEQGSSPNNYNGQEYNKEIYLHTDEAKKWDGWRTQLKPACELICVAQKPISTPTIVENVLEWGVGAFNIDVCRIEHNESTKTTNRKPRDANMMEFGLDNTQNHIASADPKGRFPTNVIIDEDVASALGNTARYFYCAKPSKTEKNTGCDKNTHATCKPLKLMSYLISLVTPSGGTVLDPFMGSGTTGIAAYKLGYNFIGIEKEKEYYDIAKERLSYVSST